ncbi:MFS transporter [Rhodobacter ferrooxidans]|uniref:Putative integral membrane transporter protein n=1 Tax=Rhodobacter ferrooxidans TaxID=371731 RepID=C8S187_9RHOB|nr:MFS transporter [Rhodobacter sp. SW2]EEW25285.1 putative integral membrane transporter protein [Rhodobacter sp. SW2]
MLTPLATIARHPTLRLIGGAMLLIGAVNASLFPYQSLVAIERVGFSGNAYALVLLCASVLAVTASVTAGIVTDQRSNRRQIAALTAATTVIGPSLMLLAPGPASLIMCHAILLPVSTSLYGQAFALAKLACAEMPAQRDAILASLRAALSLTFVVVLTVWSLVFKAGVDVMAIYWTAAVAGVLLLGLVLRRWPRDGATSWQDAPSGLNLRQSLHEIARPKVLTRLVALGAITSASALYMVLISLVFSATPGRDASDVALFVGLVAGCEVPFMLALPLVTRRWRRSVLIAAGGTVYASFLILLPLLAGSPAVWLLPLVAGLGGAATLTLPIAYLQDLMANRPGAGSSLMALQKVTADSFCALAFAASNGHHVLAAGLGGAIALAGGAALLLADRQRG